MKKLSPIVAPFVALFVALSAHAVQTVELKEVPPLKPLHFCKGPDGGVHEQIEDCKPGDTEVSSITTTDANGKVTHEPLGTKLEQPTPLPPPASKATPSAQDFPASGPGSRDDIMRKGRKSLLKVLAFGLFFGIVAKVLGRSFIRWFFVGIVVNFVLVGLNLIPS